MNFLYPMMHWLASIGYHIYGTSVAYFINRTMMFMLVNERIVVCMPGLGPLVYGISILSNVLSLPSSYLYGEIIVKGIIGVVLYTDILQTSSEQRFVFPYLIYMVFVGIFFVLGKIAWGGGDASLFTLLSIHYHACLGIVLYLETFLTCIVTMNGDTCLMRENMTGLLRYLSWFFHVFTFAKREGGWEAHQLRSILLLMAACLLLSVSFLHLFTTNETVQTEANLIHVAYVIADLYHGLRFFYSQYFSLEGCVHHVVICTLRIVLNK